MKRAWIIGVLLLMGCHKDTPPDARTGVIPGSCSYGTATLYSGTITPRPVCNEFDYACLAKTISVSVNADQATKPDKLLIYLCRNVDCTTQPLPSAPCPALSLAQQTTMACFTTLPSPHIATGYHSVTFINADIPGYSDAIHKANNTPDIAAYSSYIISEQLCQ